MQHNERVSPEKGFQVLGAGALGSLWAARLSEHHSVHIVPKLTPHHITPPLATHHHTDRPQASREEHYQFHFQDQDGIREISLPYFNLSDTTTHAKPRLSNLLVLTKSNDVLGALQALETRGLIDPQSCIVLFQNGLGSQHQVLQAFDNIPLFAAMTTEGANRQGNKIIHAGRGETRIGPLNAAAITLFEEDALQQRFRNSGFSIQFEHNIWPSLWLKLAVNCAINPFTAILDCRNGEVRRHPLFMQKWPQLLDELTTMLTLAGCPLRTEKEDAGIELETRIFQVMDNTAENISSMLQDVRAGKATEIDHINGYACEFLRQHHANHQCNQWLWDTVKALGTKP